MTTYTLKPTTEIIWRKVGANGEPVVVEQPCDCSDRIPGLEADLCLVHRIYWRDTYLEKQIRDRKSQGSSFDTNDQGDGDRKQRSKSHSEDANSGEIWGQEDTKRGDRLNQFIERSQGTLEGEETGELIRVVNISHVKGQKLPNLIVAMQSKGHPLGNPWYKEAKKDRAGSIAKCKKHLWQQYQIEGSAVRREIEAIADLVMQGEQVNLACCCKQPDVFVACHCDEIKNLLEKVVIPQRLEVAA